MILRLWFLLLIIELVSCTSSHPLTDRTFNKENLGKQLEIEDLTRIETKDGFQRFVVIDSFEETYLLGHNNKQNTLIISYDTVEEITLYRSEPTNTIVLAVGLAFLIGLLAWGAAGAVAIP